MLRGADVNGLFVSRQQIQQERREPVLLEEFGDGAIPAAEAAAAAAVREDDQAERAIRPAEIARDLTAAVNGNDHRFGCRGVRHGLSFAGFGSMSGWIRLRDSSIDRA